MPGKLIAFILILLVIGTFIGFNTGNTSDVRIWFGEKGLLTDVPILISFFVMYIIGVISVIPFVLQGQQDKRSKEKSSLSASSDVKKPGAKKNARILGAKKESPKTTTEPQGDKESDQPEESP